MRQLSIIHLLILFFLLGMFSPSYSAIKGKIDYSIPLDYSKLNEEELNEKAEYYYFQITPPKNGIIKEETTNALLLYTILTNMNPENLSYLVKLGALYDLVEKDRQAKGCFSKAIGLNSTDPRPYYYLGEFYYKRELYRKALKYYNIAYKYGYDSNYMLLYRMGDIYEKFGDSHSSLKYLNEAAKINLTTELEEKLNRIKAQDEINLEFNSNSRIRN